MSQGKDKVIEELRNQEKLLTEQQKADRGNFHIHLFYAFVDQMAKGLLF